MSAIVAVQVTGLGVWAFKHWHPAFGIGGGFAGGMHELERWALVVAAGGTVASASAIAQLVRQKTWTRALPSPTRRRRQALGVIVLVGLPSVLAAAGGSGMLDATTLGALALVYGIPWGGALIAGGWLAQGPFAAMLATCAISAALAAAHPSDELTHHSGAVVFALAAAAFAVVLCLERAAGRNALRRASDLPDHGR